MQKKIAAIVKCKVCRYEIRTDWKFCPKCGDAIVCHLAMGTSSKGFTSAKKPSKKASKK